MKRRRPSALTGCFILCWLSLAAAPACVKLPRARLPAPPPAVAPETTAARRVSLNRATRAELEQLPGVGPALAARVVEHRERYGHFRRAEHLMLVRGFGERRFRRIEPFVTAE
ncbi:MAG TPA: helix-hairpin-helix domain-containing protein [Pyrinomonadaceae bacterium]|nr:helix-hairpin-helix domain-containing protein [Pyrinomonadaceae bacterium]